MIIPRSGREFDRIRDQTQGHLGNGPAIHANHRSAKVGVEPQVLLLVASMQGNDIKAGLGHVLCA